MDKTRPFLADSLFEMAELQITFSELSWKFVLKRNLKKNRPTAQIWQGKLQNKQPSLTDTEPTDKPGSQRQCYNLVLFFFFPNK